MHNVFRDICIAFDLDGTLVDTAPDLVRALNQTVSSSGIDEISVKDVRSMVGRGARALITRAYESHGHSLTDDQREIHLAEFLSIYEQGIADLSRPFEGVVKTLEVLKQAGASLSVCTNKPGYLARKLIQELELDQYFERIVGPEDTVAKKPDAAHLLAAFGCDHRGLGILVGDSEPDALAARNAGAGSVLFTQGYSEKPVHTLGADRLFDYYTDLPSVLSDWLSKRRNSP